METQEYICDIHTKKMETHICDIYTKYNGGTQDICMTFAQTMEGQFHSEKEAKKCGSRENIREMYERKKKQESV